MQSNQQPSSNGCGFQGQMSPDPSSSKGAIWSSRFGFLMAAIGSAVGLGNVWRFPYIMGQNGGGGFLLLYLIASLIIAIPVLMAELMLGRRGRATPVLAIRNLIKKDNASRHWGFIGWGGMSVGFVILSFYSIVGGWTVYYTVLSATGTIGHVIHGFSVATGDADAVHIFQNLTSNPWMLMLWNTVFLAMCCLTIFGGIQRGIEKSVTIMMPLLFLVIVGLLIYVATLPGFWHGFYFVMDINFSQITIKSVFYALGQAFFSLSIGAGSMMAYGAYLSNDEDIPKASLIIALSDTLVAVLVGLIVFPIVFSYNLQPSSGPGLTFISLPVAFGHMHYGSIVSFAFFVLLLLAAITSAISILEPLVSFLEQSFSIKRYLATLLSAFSVWILGLLSIFSFNIWSGVHPLGIFGVQKTFFDILNFTTSNVFIPLVGLCIVLYSGYVMTKQSNAFALPLNSDSVLFRIWYFCVKFICPISILCILIVSVFFKKYI